jgi:cell division protein FtsL
MNAAAKVINQANFFTGHLSDMKISKQVCFILFLSFLVLSSALSVVFVRNEHRLAVSQLEQYKQQSNQLQLQWGQLLLEQASLATPSRIEKVAKQKMHMTLPNPQQVQVLDIE